MAEPCSMPVGMARFGVFEVDLYSGELRKSGVRIKLQDQPFKVLQALVERPGELVTRAELKSRIWPDMEFGDFDHAVNLSINKLRTALGDSADTPRFIETLPRRGYRLVAPVELLPANGASARLNSQPTAVMPSRQERSRRWMLMAGVACVAVLAGFAAWGLWPRPAIESVAVLPFTADDPSLQYLGDGLAQTLTDNLSHIPKLHVLSRNSAFQVRGAQLSSHELARRLGVRALVMGTVKRRDDGDLHVSVELLDGPEDRHIWGQEYTVGATQLASAQPRIAQDVFLGLHYRLDPSQKSRLGHRYTSNPEAYDAYLRGIFAVRHRNMRMAMDDTDKRNLLEAVKLFEKSARLDPEFALAYTGLQEAYGGAAGLGIMRPSDVLPPAEAATERALQLAPDLAEAHIAAAYLQLFLHHNLTAATAEAERAVQLDPNLPQAHHAYANMLLANRQFDQALAEQKAVIRLDPEWQVGKNAYVLILDVSGRQREAEEEARRLQPYSPRVMAIILLHQHRYHDAIRELAASKPAPENHHELLLAWAEAGLGRPEPMRELLRKKLELRRKQYFMSSQIAEYYAILRDRANTLAWMNTAIEEHDYNYFKPLMVQWDEYAFLYDDPEYQRLCRKMFTPQ